VGWRGFIAWISFADHVDRGFDRRYVELFLLFRPQFETSLLGAQEGWGSTEARCAAASHYDFQAFWHCDESRQNIAAVSIRHLSPAGFPFLIAIA